MSGGATIFTDHTVKRILSKQIHYDPETQTKYIKYLVEWDGYPHPIDFTWEPLDHLFGCLESVAQFESALQKTIKRKIDELTRALAAATADENVSHSAPIASNVAEPNPIDIEAQVINDINNDLALAVPTVGRPTEVIPFKCPLCKSAEISGEHVSTSTAAGSQETAPNVAVDSTNEPNEDNFAQAVSTATTSQAAEVKEYKCSLCKYTTNRRENLNRHLISCKEKQSRKYVCHQCDQKFESERYLLRHMRYKCKINL